MFGQNFHFADVPIPRLTSERLTLRPWQRSDAAAFHRLRLESYDHLQKFEPLWGEDALKGKDFPRRWQRWQEMASLGRTLALGIFQRNSQALLGGIQLNEIIRGALQSATISYWCGEPYKNQGVVSEAVPLIIGLAFNQLHLHRLEGYCVPENLASQRVLLKSGFQAEGMARDYLRINGTWRDHLRFYRTNEFW